MEEKALVIGGSGFVGSHIADCLSDRGYAVSIFDQSESPWLRPDQKMIIGDYLDRPLVDRAIRGVNVVYHFGGVADIDESANNPYETIHSNVLGTTCVLEAAVRNKVKRFLYASTVYVYSQFGSIYRASKQASEILIEAYSDEYNLDYTMLRYGSLYGPRAQKWNGLRRMVEGIVSNNHYTIGGTGQEMREYIHVNDAATLSVDVLDDTYKNCAVTITGTQVLSSRNLTEMICEISGSNTNIDFQEAVKSTHHYTLTPYRYTPKSAKKLVPKEFVDIGQGILEVVEDLDSKSLC